MVEKEKAAEKKTEVEKTVKTESAPQPAVVDANKTNSKALVAMILGIVGAVCSFIPFVNIFGLIVAIVGLVFAIKAKKEIALTGAPGNGMAIAGLILSIAAIVISLIGIICTISAIIYSGALWYDMMMNGDFSYYY